MAGLSEMSVMLFPWGVKKPSAGEIVAAAKLAEDLGFHSVTLPTHMTMPPGWLFEHFPNRDVLDALVVVPAIAAATTRIRVGFNSVVLPTLPPYAWAKYLATLDCMSQGRLIAGAAMGWWEEDFSSVGVDRRRRGRLFDEQLEIITRLWTEESVSFQGTHYRLAGIGLEPKPLQKPHPPIWIGGGAKSIERTARYGECLLTFWPSEHDARERWLPQLAEAGARHGTQPKLAAFTFVFVAHGDDELDAVRPIIEQGVTFESEGVDAAAVTLTGSPERCAERVDALRAAGVWHFVLEFQFHGLKDVTFGMRQMERFAREVGPLV
jgi:alkanesulfonate monooxygenase